MIFYIFISIRPNVKHKTFVRLEIFLHKLKLKKLTNKTNWIDWSKLTDEKENIEINWNKYLKKIIFKIC